ncbi:S24 family peptidase [Vibrio sp. Y2-5]|uniref:S24 family peptidase n=1 Tax=Vibrio sp. Y2-5 TaxID=2743977 RepID=UPI001CB72BED
MPIVSKFESPANEYASLSELDLHELVVGEKKHATFFCVANGDGLRSRGIFNNDLLVANRALTATHGDVIVALVDGEFIVRVFDVNHHCLRSDNEPPIPLNEMVVVEAVISQSLRCLRPLNYR